MPSPTRRLVYRLSHPFRHPSPISPCPETRQRRLRASAPEGLGRPAQPLPAARLPWLLAPLEVSRRSAALPSLAHCADRQHLLSTRTWSSPDPHLPLPALSRGLGRAKSPCGDLCRFPTMYVPAWHRGLRLRLRQLVNTESCQAQKRFLNPFRRVLER